MYTPTKRGGGLGEGRQQAVYYDVTRNLEREKKGVVPSVYGDAEIGDGCGWVVRVPSLPSSTVCVHARCEGCCACGDNPGVNRRLCPHAARGNQKRWEGRWDGQIPLK